MDAQRDRLRISLFVFYVLAAATVIVSLAPYLLVQPLDCSSLQPCLITLRGLFALTALVALFVVLPPLFRRFWTWNANGIHDAPKGPADKVFFPHGATRPVAWVVFGWLVISIVLLVLAFWDPWALNQPKASHIYEMLVAASSAGAGSSVATIMAYLHHASRKGDFTYAYVPWYLMRPLLGSLLGLIFYFLMRGGILAVLETPPQDGGNLDDLALAGISSLVGLFSNEAYMKLQEVFNTLFKVQKQGQQQ